jgi:hypothetical protein
MKPGDGSFTNANGCKWLGWEGRQYVIGAPSGKSGVKIALPAGSWKVLSFDIKAKQMKTVAASASGPFSFDIPSSSSSMVLFTHSGVAYPKDGGSTIAVAEENGRPAADASPRGSIRRLGPGTYAVDIEGIGLAARRFAIGVCDSRGREAAFRVSDAGKRIARLEVLTPGTFVVRATAGDETRTLGLIAVPYAR